MSDFAAGLPCLLMEDHREAYFFWKESAVKGSCCVHVDAHLDISNFKVPEFDPVDPHINCANFLYHACAEGMVSHVVWVIPPHLRAAEPSFLDWSQSELQRWMNLSVGEFASLRLEQSRIEGTLAGARLTICESDNLPALTGPLLLDIDIDYFLDPHDGLFQNPLQLHGQLLEGGFPAARVQALTVAYSVKGGYTPLKQRYLGPLTELAFSGRLEEAQRWWSILQRGVDDPAAPPWLRAAVLLAAAQSDHQGPPWDAAALLDPAYRVNPADVASMYQIRRDLKRCLEWLTRCPQEELLSLYLAGFAAFREGDMELASEKWQALLEHSLGQVTRCHVLELHGRALRRRELHQAAVETFRQACQLDPRSAVLWRELARAQAAAGSDEEAARSYRKALNLGPEELASVEARLELAQLYQRLGQITLAQAECRRVHTGAGPQGLRLQAELLGWRLGRTGGPS